MNDRNRYFEKYGHKFGTRRDRTPPPAPVKPQPSANTIMETVYKQADVWLDYVSQVYGPPATPEDTIRTRQFITDSLRLGALPMVPPVEHPIDCQWHAGHSGKLKSRVRREPDPVPAESSEDESDDDQYRMDMA